MSNPLNFLLDGPQSERDVYRWATVATVSPLRIRLDQETTPLLARPINLAGPLSTGDRVWVQFHRGRDSQGAQVLIIGRGQSEQGQPWRQAAGVAVYTSGGRWQEVMFPPGRFTVMPVVVASITSGAGAHSGATVRAIVEAIDRGRIHVRLPSGAAGDGVVVAWHAIQMAPASAAG